MVKASAALVLAYFPSNIPLSATEELYVYSIQVGNNNISPIQTHWL